MPQKLSQQQQVCNKSQTREWKSPDFYTVEALKVCECEEGNNN